MTLPELPYLLFEGDDYYPEGGWKDFAGAFETVEAAQAAKKDHLYEGGWAHVVDSVSREIVCHKSRGTPWLAGAPFRWPEEE